MVLQIKDSKEKKDSIVTSPGPLAKDLRDWTGRGYKPVGNKPASDRPEKSRHRVEKGMMKGQANKGVR